MTVNILGLSERTAVHLNSASLKVRTFISLKTERLTRSSWRNNVPINNLADLGRTLGMDNTAPGTPVLCFGTGDGVGNNASVQVWKCCSSGLKHRSAHEKSMLIVSGATAAMT